ncbi:GAF domain-containing protein [Marinomonas rhodophyticola]|uniref:GAF domain-containing protein n=1 Tax=Marinomonas rhodophyticola TaxID=2992803 RepID=A0ABT3KJ27_9GAMM|nr:GAF domain-containing protein [Marinomonas sp. KJ51-3]MCW4630439.1 GAF domain-containing protein [Marinomonas sp. KJ51-3]
MENRPETNIQLKDILEMAPIAVAWSDITSDRIDYINKSFSTLFGYSLKDLPDLNTWYDHAFPDPYYYQQVIEPWIRHNQENVPVEGLSTRMFCKDGSVKKVRISFSIVADKRLWYFNDITDYWIAEKRLRARSEMLEMVAKSSALTNILDVIVKQIQYESPLSLCSVLLFDQASQCLFLGAAPDFPDFYNKAVDGIKIDLNVGSCGTAAYLKTRVIVEDIFSHRYWQDYTALARKAGLAACWSDPIMSSKGELLGTFAIYKRIPSSPTQKELELINFASNLASIAIESFSSREEPRTTGLF